MEDSEKAKSQENWVWVLNWATSGKSLNLDEPH